MYGLVAIVKNAAATIDACLASARPYLSHWTIVDTGSSDDTMDRVRVAFGNRDRRGRFQRQVPGTLHRSPWVNFGQNRSESLALARGTADWLLALDADMTVEIDPDFVPDPAIDAYMIEMRDSGASWRLPLLLRGDLPWESRGACHAYTALPDRPYRSRPTDAVRVHFPPTQSSPSKRHWQAGMLEEDLARDPANPRTMFYLAQTYRELGDPRARDLYLRRATMGGFAEETWYAAYRAALLAPWPGQAAELMAAWEQRPSRLEPLHALVSELNRRGSHHAAYRLAILPDGPCADGLFVQRSVWDWGMKFERSVAAWHAGQREESRGLCDELLAGELPDHIRRAVERNRAF